VIEKSENNYGAYSPDVPGCGTVGDTLEEVKQNIVEALLFHMEGLIEDGLPIPEATTQVEYVEIKIPQMS
jgi:predicted RNase H-like HicB family nuclease